MSAIDVSSLGIIALVPDRWSGMWQARHHLLSRVAEQCHVAWMNPAHHWRSILRPRAAAPSSDTEAPHCARLKICEAPLWLPRFYSQPRLNDMTLALRLRSARESLIRAGAKYIVLYVWRPEFAPALRLVRHHLSCYHIDDEYSFAASKVPMSASELFLLQQVGQVFIHSDTMLRAKGGINPHTSHIPNGVDYARYSVMVPEPDDLRAIPRPRIGYSGWLKPQINWRLLQALAERHSDWSFVFVGDQQRQPEVADNVARLRRLPNVHFLGGRPTAALHGYVQHFDVALMPYELNEYTHFIYPVKVHEYLAAGSPVVASPLPNLREFENVLTLADSVDEWSCAISTALMTGDNQRARQARQVVASRHDWSTLAGRVVSILQTRLQPGAPQ
jgi:glycosyltransferase involved in cell wall biosynthesis